MTLFIAGVAAWLLFWSALLSLLRLRDRIDTLPLTLLDDARPAPTSRRVGRRVSCSSDR